MTQLDKRKSIELVVARLQLIDKLTANKERLDKDMQVALQQELYQITAALGRQCYDFLLQKEFVFLGRRMNAATLIIEKVEQRAASGTRTGKRSRKDIAMEMQAGLVMLVSSDSVRVGATTDVALLTSLLAETVFADSFEEFIKAASNARYRRANKTTCPAVRIGSAGLDYLRTIAVDCPL